LSVGETGKANARKGRWPFAFLHLLGTNCPEVVRSATHISLVRHKTAILGMALPLGCGSPEGQAASLSTPVRGRGVAMPHLRRWYRSLVLLWEKSQRTRRPAPRQSWGPPLFSCGEDQLLSYTKDKKERFGRDN